MLIALRICELGSIKGTAIDKDVRSPTLRPPTQTAPMTHHPPIEAVVPVTPPMQCVG